MSVLKYIDPETGERRVSTSVNVVGGGMSEQLTASGYPDYIAPEVADMVKRVTAVRKKDSIVFIAMSDSHYCGEQTSIQNAAETNASADQANRAAKVLTYLVRPDFVAHLGDVSCGHNSTTPDMLKKQIEEFTSMFREARSDIPMFVAIGNHDAGIYYHNEQTDGGVHTLAGYYLYKNFTALSESNNTVIGGKENGGYCYRDFPDKKLRVFLLNTSEKLVAVQTDQATYGAQRVWLANALLDLNTKADATEWSFIILSHYPADYGNNMPLSELIKAYVEGASFTITDPVSDYYVGDKTSHAVDFNGKNGAKMIAQFHGHVHNFKTSKLYSYATGSGVQYDAHRVCIPNGQYNRENYYTTVGKYTDIDFSEDTDYPKTANTADGTSFVVNVINPSEQILYSLCYGAGYDRTVGYGSTVYHSVTLNLSNVSISSEQRSVVDGEAYTTTLTTDEGYLFKRVEVTMSGKDITATVYADGVITIPEVTGNIVITAIAQQKPNFTNLVPTSVDENGELFNVDGLGYANNTYINSSGVASTRKNTVTTGFIAVTAGVKTIRVAGEGLSIDSTYTRVAGYDKDFNLISNISYNNMNKTSGGNYYNGKLIDEDSTLFTLELQKVSNLAKAVYLRVSVNGDGADLIVTVDEEISYGNT